MLRVLPCVIALPRYCVFCLFVVQIEGLCQVYGSHFTNICSLRVSVSHFSNFYNVSNVFIIIIFVMVICDQMLLLELFWDCVLTAPLSWGLYSLRHNNIAIRPVNDATIASKCSSERKSCTCLILNQQLEMIKLKEQGM